LIKDQFEPKGILNTHVEGNISQIIKTTITGEANT
jgi:hypothetical protein